MWRKEHGLIPKINLSGKGRVKEEGSLNHRRDISLCLRYLVAPTSMGTNPYRDSIKLDAYSSRDIASSEVIVFTSNRVGEENIRRKRYLEIRDWSMVEE
jgi:hypothetical protein